MYSCFQNKQLELQETLKFCLVVDKRIFLHCPQLILSNLLVTALEYCLLSVYKNKFSAQMN